MLPGRIWLLGVATETSQHIEQGHDGAAHKHIPGGPLIRPSRTCLLLVDALKWMPREPPCLCDCLKTCCLKGRPIAPEERGNGHVRKVDKCQDNKGTAESTFFCSE